MSAGSLDQFTLIRERASLDYRQRLTALSLVASSIVHEPTKSFATTNLLGDEHHWLKPRLQLCKHLTYDALSARFVLHLEAINDEYYLLQIAGREHGFDIFAGGATAYRFVDEKDPALSTLHYRGTGHESERFTLEGTNVDLALQMGLDRIMNFIRQDQERTTRKRLKQTESVHSEDYAPMIGGDIARRSVDVPRYRTGGIGFALNQVTLDAGFFTYAAGVIGAAVAMSWGMGPGWLGFVTLFVPASALAAWAVVPHA